MLCQQLGRIDCLIERNPVITDWKIACFEYLSRWARNRDISQSDVVRAFQQRVHGLTDLAMTYINHDDGK